MKAKTRNAADEGARRGRVAQRIGELRLASPFSGFLFQPVHGHARSLQNRSLAEPAGEQNSLQRLNPRDLVFQLTQSAG